MEIKWPTWQVDNAATILENSKKRLEKALSECEDKSRADILEGQIRALDLGISVVRSIPEHTPPTLPSLKLLFRNVIGEVVNDLGRALENAGSRLQDANSWGWKKDPYD